MTTETQTTRAFMRALNITKRGTVAALTGQDAIACSAIARLADLWMVADARGRAFTVEAIHTTLHAVQPTLRGAVMGAIGYIVGDDRLLSDILTACDESVQGHRCGGLLS